MINILLITTDQRAMALVEQFKSQPQLRVDVVSDFDQGMKDIFDKRPQLVFIQGEIDGVSGETVARHIKGLLREQSPRLVLLRETLQVRLGAKSCYDGSVDLFLDGDDILKAFRTQMENIPGFSWQDPLPGQGPVVPVMSTADQYAAALAAATAESAGSFSAVPPHASSPQTEGFPRERHDSPDVQQPVPSSTTRQEPQSSLATEPLAPPLRDKAFSPSVPPPDPVYNVEMPPPQPISAAGGMRKPAEFRGTFPPLTNKFNGHKSQRRPWRYVIACLAALAVCAFVYLYIFSSPGNAPAPVSKDVGPTSPAGQQSSTAPASERILASIPRDRPDAGYAAAHPGWERFTSDTMDFRVFRESGAVKAIQIIALGKGALSDAYVAERIRDVSGNNAYQVGFRADKDGFLVEKGSAKGNIELAIYRKRPSGEIRALVIALP